ncbi:MAG: hypothetical protein ACXVRV_14590 [Gaiellaceae bacterium]
MHTGLARLRRSSTPADRVGLPTDAIRAYSEKAPSWIADEIANLRERHDTGVLSDTDYAGEVARMVQGASGRCYDSKWLNELVARRRLDP